MRLVSRLMVRGVASLALVAAIACGSSGVDRATEAALAGGCVVNSDCNDGLACAFRTCHDPCNTTRDCAAGSLCVLATAPLHVCQLPAEEHCATNADCVAGEVCAVDARCRDACRSAHDCTSGQLCVSGTCADSTALPVATADSGSDGGALSVDTSCSYASDCAAGLICLEHACAYACNTDVDCASDQECRNHACVSLGSDSDATLHGAGAACSYTSDCQDPYICTRGVCAYACESDRDCASGASCAGHRCVSVATRGDASGASDATTGAGSDGSSGSFDGGHEGGTLPDGGCAEDADCQDGVFCDGFERCVAGGCQSGRAACDDQDPCTADTCNEAARSCAHDATHPVDQDGDGHFALGCGGSADDCDDHNPAVYPGHGEVCDYLDNNCNGTIDEGMWSSSGKFDLAGNAATNVQGASSLFAGSPSLVRLVDGSFALSHPEIVQGASTLFFSHLGASLITVGAPLNLGGAAVGVASATNGNVVGNVELTASTAYAQALSATPSLLGSGTAAATSTSYVPSVQWLAGAGKFLVVSADTHGSAAPTAYGNVFVANLSTSGVLSAPTLLNLPEPQTRAALMGTSSSVALHVVTAVGPTTILVAWSYASTGHVRYVLLDGAGTTVTHGPFDLSGTLEALGAGAAHVGASFLLVTRAAPTNDIAIGAAELLRIDDATGAVLATLAVPGSVGQASSGEGDVLDVALAPLGPGVGMTFARGGELGWAWVPEALTGATFGLDIALYSKGDNYALLTSGSIAAVDGKHAAVAWFDIPSNGTLTTLMTCGNGQ